MGSRANPTHTINRTTSKPFGRRGWCTELTKVGEASRSANMTNDTRSNFITAWNGKEGADNWIERGKGNIA